MTPPRFPHSYPFDPGYGYQPADLLAVTPPDYPTDFAAFWQARHQAVRCLDPQPVLTPTTWPHPDYAVMDLSYHSTDGLVIGGWALLPRSGRIRQGYVVGHGYGGRDAPDFDLPVHDAVLLFPCVRGISRSRHPPISDNPAYHVLHDIDKRDRYILGGCVEDLWLAVSALLALFPDTFGHVGYLGISLGGGLGALALPWDERIQRGHLNVPSFGHYPLRLQLPTCGSGDAVRRYERETGHVMETLQYYDAASAARFITQPVHVAAALFDPCVAPPGQFAIYNALPGPKQLFVLDAGHFEYPGMSHQHALLKQELSAFFETL
jgi:cephalosporin-C deacetylase